MTNKLGILPQVNVSDKSSFAGFVHELARISPRAALMAAIEGAAQPRVMPAQITFDNPNADQSPIKKEIKIQSSLFVITDIVYNVTRPTYYAGNIQKAQSDLANAKSPGIMIKLWQQNVWTGEQYSIVCSDMAPVENVFRHATSNEPTCFLKDWRVAYPQTMDLYATLSRQLDVDVDHGSEIPYTLYVTFKGRIVSCRILDRNPEARNWIFEEASQDELLEEVNKRLHEFGIAGVQCGSCAGLPKRAGE